MEEIREYSNFHDLSQVMIDIKCQKMINDSQKGRVVILKDYLIHKDYNSSKND